MKLVCEQDTSNTRTPEAAIVYAGLEVQVPGKDVILDRALE